MKNKKVSIIIPAFNSEKYIRECIESVIEQSYRNIEIIIVNDGSTDNTGEIIEEIEQKDKRIIVKNIQNSGPCIARGVGVDFATGDYVMFLDADDKLYKNAAEKIVGYFNNNPEVDSIKYNFTSNDKRYWGNIKITEKKILSKDEKIKKILFSDFFSNMWTQAFKLSKIKGINAFNNKLHYCEDYVSNFMIHSKINNTLLVEDTLYYYRTNTNSTTHIFSIDKAFEKIKNRIESGHIIFSNMDNEKKNLFSKTFVCRQMKLIQDEVAKSVFMTNINKNDFSEKMKSIFAMKEFNELKDQITRKELKKYISTMPFGEKIKRGKSIISLYNKDVNMMYYIFNMYRCIKKARNKNGR